MTQYELDESFWRGIVWERDSNCFVDKLNFSFLMSVQAQLTADIKKSDFLVFFSLKENFLKRIIQDKFLFFPLFDNGAE